MSRTTDMRIAPDEQILDYPLGHDIHWGTHRVVNIGPQGHKLQWFKGIMYCIQGGTWTAQGGRPRRL
eukprot:11166702-Karenia_brevis.AAC.1